MTLCYSGAYLLAYLHAQTRTHTIQGLNCISSAACTVQYSVYAPFLFIFIMYVYLMHSVTQ